MNVPLLRKIQQVIAESPAEFYMGMWHQEDSRACDRLSDVNDLCGTTHCIAGWAQVLSPEHQSSTALLDGQKALGLDFVQADRLFYASRWPIRFWKGFQPSVENAIARIDHFIETGGAE